MALQYRDTRRGTVVTVLEPQEVEAAEKNPHQGKWLGMHQRRTIHKMDLSSRWERVTDAPKTEPSAPVEQAAPLVQVEPIEPEEPEFLRDGPEPTPEEVAAVQDAPKRPAANDPKAIWVDWAVAAHGYDRDEAEGLSKDQLRELPR